MKYVLESRTTVAAAGLALVGLFALAGCSTPAQPTQVSAPVVTATALPATAVVANNAADPATTAPDPATTAADAGGASAVTCTKLNLNTETEAQLTSTIPNFPNRMVREFFEYRPYVSIQQFRREIGKYVDQAQVGQWEQYVYVPVDPNQSDAATLMQIPGVDETVAAALTGGRPYASSQAFLDALASHVSADQLAQASCFLSQ